MAELEIRQTYPLSTSFWTQEGALNVEDVEGNFVLSIPVGFMNESGDRNWRFVDEVIRDCVKSTGSICTATGQPVDSSDIPLPGNYIFICTGRPALSVLKSAFYAWVTY